MIIPLIAYVMFGEPLAKAGIREIVLAPAVPATLILYAVAMASWRESWVAVLGGTLVFFWVFHRRFGALPAAARSQQADPAVCDARHRDGRHHLLARYGPQGPGHALPHAVGLPARAGLGRYGNRSRLCRRLHFRPDRRLCQRHLGRDHLLRLQRAAVVPGDGAVHPDPELSRAERISTSSSPSLSPRRRQSCVSCAVSPSTTRRGTMSSPRRPAASTRSASWCGNCCPTCAVRSSSMPACALATRQWRSPTLTFLGLGLQPPDPDWGLMIKEASNLMVWQFSYMLLIPALAVSSLILGFNLMARRPARNEPARLGTGE